MMEWFTKGEWMVVCGAGFDDEIGVGMDSYLKNPDDYYTNHLWTCDIQPYDADKECMANAHLIAAAPEMYEMLKSIHQCLGWGYTNAELADNLAEYGAALERLLAKARGEK